MFIIIVIIIIELDQNLRGHMSYAVDYAHRPPLHGSAVAARAAPGTHTHTHARTHARTHTHTHTRLTGFCPGLPG